MRLNKERIFAQIRIAVDAYKRSSMASDLNMEYSTLSNELNPNESSSHAKLGFLTALGILENTQGSFASEQSKQAGLMAMDLIEEGLGRVAFPIPASRAENLAPIIKLVAVLSKEFGETVQAFAQTIKDEKITKKEARECIKETADLIKVCVEFQANLKRYL